MSKIIGFIDGIEEQQAQAAAKKERDKRARQRVASLKQAGANVHLTKAAGPLTCAIGDQNYNDIAAALVMQEVHNG